MEHYNLSARNFSRALGVPDNNTQNYINLNPALPKADYLEKVLHHFQSVNPAWLLTGQGEPFLDDGSNSSTTTIRSGQKNKGNIQGNTGGTNTINNLTVEDCRRELEAVKRDAASYQREIELLKGQLEDKNEIITLLRANNNRTN
jgi:hypothetical protein